MNGQTVPTRVVLIELTDHPAAAELALGLARAGHSIGLAHGANAESAADGLQARLERMGGISLAINLDEGGMARAIHLMTDVFGRLDEIACFTPPAAEAAAEAISTFPSRQRPRVRVMDRR